MCKPNVAVAGSHRFFDNGCAVFAPPGRGMSHNDRTPQGVGVWPASIPRERQLARRNGGPGVQVRNRRHESGRASSRWRLGERTAGQREFHWDVGPSPCRRSEACSRCRPTRSSSRSAGPSSGASSWSSRGLSRVSRSCPRCWWRSRSPCWSALPSTSCCGNWARRTCPVRVPRSARSPRSARW